MLTLLWWLLSFFTAYHGIWPMHKVKGVQNLLVEKKKGVLLCFYTNWIYWWIPILYTLTVTRTEFIKENNNMKMKIQFCLFCLHVTLVHVNIQHVTSFVRSYLHEPIYYCPVLCNHWVKSHVCQLRIFSKESASSNAT